jgi:hypothetical protein
MNVDPVSLEPVHCSEAAQNAGECLGWTGTIGAHPVAVTVSSALLLDNAAGARKFYEKHREEVDPATRILIERALDLEPLEGAAAAARILSSLVYPSPERLA